MNINSDYSDLKNFYDNTLNKDLSTFVSSNDEPTPIDCIEEMIQKIPNNFWNLQNLKILDPCCGNGNFFIPILYKLIENFDKKEILEQKLDFNDVNLDRLDNVKKIFCNDNYKLNISNKDFLKDNFDNKYDLIVANPPYAKIQENGKRASKIHNLIKSFIEKSLNILKPNGYLLFICPNNWMSLSDSNNIIKKMIKLQFIHIDIHNAKKYFKKIGSSFTWFILQNKPSIDNFTISCLWKKKIFNDVIKPITHNYIPLLYNSLVQGILIKTLEREKVEKFKIETNSYLHKYTKRQLISSIKDDLFKYRLIHTPKQTVYSKIPHKLQCGYKIFIPTTDKYIPFIDDCGMTQSIAYIKCDNLIQATKILNILKHPLYIFLNNICRFGNFNNIRILQKFPIPCDESNIFESFNISKEEELFILENI